MEVETKSPEETKRLAFDLAKKLKGGEVLALFGDLGSGKTTFVQGLAEGLGVKERVLSPSYVLMRKHEVRGERQEARGKRHELRNLYHVDLYRLAGVADVESLGLEEIMGKRENVVVIEWAERMGAKLPVSVIRINFDVRGENGRRITISKIKSTAQRSKLI